MDYSRRHETVGSEMKSYFSQCGKQQRPHVHVKSSYFQVPWDTEDGPRWIFVYTVGCITEMQPEFRATESFVTDSTVGLLVFALEGDTIYLPRLFTKHPWKDSSEPKQYLCLQETHIGDYPTTFPISSFCFLWCIMHKTSRFIFLKHSSDHINLFFNSCLGIPISYIIKSTYLVWH